MMDASKASLSAKAALLNLYRCLFGDIPLSGPAISIEKTVLLGEQAPHSPLHKLIVARRSSRTNRAGPVPLLDALTLLRDAIGMTLQADGAIKYAVPLAGGVPELRIFVFIRQAGIDFGCWEFLQQTSSANKLNTPRDFNPFIDSWEQCGGLSIIFAYPEHPQRTYSNNLFHAFVETGLMSQNIALLALERLGRQSCMGGIVDVPAFCRVLGRDPLPLHAITINE